ncbi:MAG: endonuclease III [Candidatus Paracaedimonas acanthamoebae]|uniref:Endonuclease III n=1 Tax=Candidatus Paracaedimonas acanthamoebae TaxID=244581 RepID=A0A8J7PRB8_9PROT|nr:endonuclease III [Candidatus Paracaedimonas acanthamoebae]
MLSLSAIAKIFKKLSFLNPEPTTELESTNPYTLLVAVVLSAQSTDKGVNKATRPLFEKISTPQQMVELGEEHLKQAIRTIGFYNTKAKNIIRLSEILIREYQGKIPENREALEKLPGVGRKTANVILNTAFGEPVMAVDTHVFRVSNRLGICAAKTPLEVEKALMAKIPSEYLQHAHHWLILHGRYTCLARKPKCYLCPVVELCEYKEKNLVKRKA